MIPWVNKWGITRIERWMDPTEWTWATSFQANWSLAASKHVRHVNARDHTTLRLLFNTYFWFSNSNCQSTEWESFNIPREFGELWRYSQSVQQFFGSACTGLNTLILPAAVSFLALTNVQIWISLRSSFYQFWSPSSPKCAASDEAF